MSVDSKLSAHAGGRLAASARSRESEERRLPQAECCLVMAEHFGNALEITTAAVTRETEFMHLANVRRETLPTIQIRCNT